MTTLSADFRLTHLLTGSTDERESSESMDAKVVARASGVADDEEALSAAALQSDRAAWQTLIQRHNHRVLVSLLARGIRVDRAHELVQETWLILIQRQRAGRLEMLKLPGLAIVQAHFLAREDYRRAAGNHATASLDEARTGDDPALDPEERLLAREQLSRARDVLAGCSRSTQTVFHLLYEQPGLSHADAAKRAGLSLQRVRQILCNLRKKLRAAVLEAEGTEESPHENG